MGLFGDLKQKKSGETLQSLRALLRWMDAFQTRNLPAIRETLAPYEGKTLRVTKAMPTGDILSALEDILIIMRTEQSRKP